MDTSHIVFFFGSGASLPSRMPTVNEITQKVLTEPLIFTEHRRYVFPSSVESDLPNPELSHDSSSEYVAKARGFLVTVLHHAQTVLSESGLHDQQITYEDLYYLCKQVVSDQTAGNDTPVAPMNLAIRPFSEKLQHEAEPFLLRNPNDPLDDLAYTAREATFLITGVVRELLSKIPDTIQGFDPLLDAVNELDWDKKGPERITIVTLNHDLLIEQLLTKQGLKPGVDFDDGFGKQKGELRFYKPERLFSGAAKVRIIKPHGSINWYRVRREDQGFTQAQYIICSGDGFDELRDAEGQKYEALFPEPTIITDAGKEEYYQTDIFGDMIEAFQHSLRQTDVVIESGFGWMDQGIYDSLHRYLNRRDATTLLLLHPEDDFSEDHPLGLPTGPLLMPGLTDAISKFMCDTSWNEIKRTLSRF